MKILLGDADCKSYQKALAHFENIETVCTRICPESADEFDALILPGGDDIDPALFGQEFCGTRDVDRALDDAQLAMCGLFVKAKKPILGICKGEQIINVYFGGDIIQDLPDGTRERHQYHKGEGTGEFHDTMIEPGTFLYDLYGANVRTNSFHHQAVGRVGEGLKVIQKSDDGVIEFIMHETLPVYGSQWHPEKYSFEETREEGCDGAPLIEWFLKQVVHTSGK